MNDEPEAEVQPGSVFGNLPGSRPGTRSPRRNGERKPRAAKATAAKPARPKPPPSVRRPTSPPPPEPVEPAEEPRAGGGLEDIAWAGVAAAAEAATLGVRLASKALEALRGSSEKS